MNLDTSTHTLIPGGEREEKTVGEELNRSVDHDGDPVEEPPTTGERTREKSGECDEFEPAIEE